MKPARSKIICWKHLFVDTFLYICLNFLLGSDSAASLATCTFVFARISCSPTIQCKSVLNQKYFQHPTNQQHHPPQCWHRHMSGRWWWWGGERLHKDFPQRKTHRLPKDSILHQQHLQISFSSQLHKTNSSSCTSLELASENALRGKLVFSTRCQVWCSTGAACRAERAARPALGGIEFQGGGGGCLV